MLNIGRKWRRHGSTCSRMIRTEFTRSSANHLRQPHPPDCLAARSLLTTFTLRTGGYGGGWAAFRVEARVFEAPVVCGVWACGQGAEKRQASLAGAIRVDWRAERGLEFGQSRASNPTPFSCGRARSLAALPPRPPQTH